MHWLAEHAPKYAKYQFTKLGPLTVRDPKEGAKIILKLFFLTQLSNCFFLTLSEQVFKKKKTKKQKTKNKTKKQKQKQKKNKEHYQTEKNSENFLFLILGALVERTRPKLC